MDNEQKEFLTKLLKVSMELGLPLLPSLKKKQVYGLQIPQDVFNDETFHGLIKDLGYNLALLNGSTKVKPKNPKSRIAYSIISNNINTNNIKNSLITLRGKTWDEVKRDADAIGTLVENVFETWNKQDANYRKSRKVTDGMVRGYIKLMTTGEWTHTQIIESIKNYALWSRCAKEDNNVWFHRWNLEQFLLSNKAIYHCEDRKSLIADKNLNIGRADSPKIKYFTREDMIEEDKRLKQGQFAEDNR